MLKGNLKLQKLTTPLPVKNGVAPNKVWLPQGEWKTVFEYFCWRFSRQQPSQCQARFERGEVCFDDGELVSLSTPYQAERHLYFYHEVENELEVPFREKIIYQDENIIVADKPHFLPVAPSGNYLQHTLLVRLRRALNNNEIQLCHRLDRETAGLVLLSKKASVRGAYQQLFADRRIVKTYFAIAKKLKLSFPYRKISRLESLKSSMCMREVAGEENSETIISIEQKGHSNNLYKLQPVTGKKHQLRVHMASLGAAILNDPLYFASQNKPAPHSEITHTNSKPSNQFTEPLQLLAKQLEFIDPITGTKHCFTSEQSLHLKS